MPTSYRSTRVRRPSSLSVSGPDRPLIQAPAPGRSNPHTTAFGRPARSHLVYSRPAYSRPARSCSGHSPLAYSPAADSLPASAHSARTTPHAIPRRSSPASDRSEHSRNCPELPRAYTQPNRIRRFRIQQPRSRQPIRRLPDQPHDFPHTRLYRRCLPQPGHHQPQRRHSQPLDAAPNR